MDLFLHEWSVESAVITEWSTDVSVSRETLAEERRGLVGRPRRTVAVRWLSRNRNEANRLLFQIMKAADSELEVPLYPDVSITTASSSGFVINCPTANRRFHVGQRVVICTAQGASPQFRVIAAVAADSIDVTVALTGSFDAGSIVFPTLQALAVLEAELVPVTDQVATVEGGFSEILGTALPAFCDFDDLDDYDFATADDGDGNEYYVLDLEPNWRAEPRLRAVRSGSQERLGRDEVVLARGPRPLLEIAFEITTRDRAEFARALAFFDAHRGAYIPFFVANPLTIWEAEAIATGYVDVAQDGDLADAQGYADFVAVEAGGVRYVRPITSIAVQGDAWRITVGVNFPALSVGDVTKVTTAHLCRFASDALEERWSTSGVAQIRFAVRELVSEASVGVTNPTWSEPACED